MEINVIQQEYLKSVILSQLLLEANESLFFTTQYKQQIKHKINSLNKDLEETVRKEYSIIYNTDPETTTNILNSIESIVKKLQTSYIPILIVKLSCFGRLCVGRNGEKHLMVGR